LFEYFQKLIGARRVDARRFASRCWPVPKSTASAHWNEDLLNFAFLLLWPKRNHP